MSNILGYVPKSLTIVAKSPRGVSWEWDGFTRKKVYTGEVVRPAFIVDAENPKTIETARSWARRGRYASEDGKFEEISVPNDPIKIRIMGLEYRGEGGRAYKVVFGEDGTNNPFYVDLREDVLLDTILNSNIAYGCVKDSTFIWAVLGSQMRLVRVGSDLHEGLIEATEFRKLKKIPKQDLVIGGVYKNKRGEMSVYAGEYYVLVDKEQKDIFFLYFAKRQVWFKTWDRELQSGKLDRDTTYFHSAKSASVYEKVGDLDIGDWKKALFDYGMSQISKTNINGNSYYNRDYGYRNLFYYLENMLVFSEKSEVKLPENETLERYLKPYTIRFKS